MKKPIALVIELRHPAAAGWDAATSPAARGDAAAPAAEIGARELTTFKRA